LPRRFSRRDRAAKERELITEPSPIRGFQVAGIVPPLGLKFGMRPVIVGERERADAISARIARDALIGLQANNRRADLW